MTRDATPAPTDTCPCGRGLGYGRCCAPLHDAGHAGIGTSAEDTMRARYSAYVVGDEAFLLATWHESTRPDSVAFSDDVTWEGLTIVASAGSMLDATGSVEFRARFRRNDTPLELHERSSFVRDAGRWYYVSGHNPDSPA